MKKKSEPIRIGMIIGKWVGGGVEAVIMNYYRHIDRSKIQFDFICDEDSTDIPYEEIEKLGGKIIICPPYQKLPKYLKELKRIFKENNYKIVHSNINTLSVFPLYAAKKAGVPVRIAHSHSTTNKKEWKKNLLKQVLRIFSKRYATEYMCCSELAGRWQFGDKAFEEGKVTIINNGIEIESFKYNKWIRRKVRKEFKYNSNDFVIGHVGRFVKPKNHDFIIEVFSEIHKKNNNYKLMLVGKGPLVNTIKSKVHNLGLDEYVKFLGQRSDVNELYQAMDLLFFPSLYEGLGMAMIEAQCSGLPCVASTKVPEIVKITNAVDFLSLNENIGKWVKEITKYYKIERKVNYNIIKNSAFDINKESKKLEKKYIELCN